MEIDLNDYDIPTIRDYLIDYYGTASVSVSPFATVDLIDVENLNDIDIVIIANKLGILNNFYKKYTR